MNPVCSCDGARPASRRGYAAAQPVCTPLVGGSASSLLYITKFSPRVNTLSVKSAKTVDSLRISGYTEAYPSNFIPQEGHE